jgi:hypothetical protein
VAFTKLKELIEAAKANDVDLINSFCTLPEDDAPSENNIKDALKEAAEAESLAVLNYLCKSVANQYAINNAFKAAYSAKKWKSVETLCAYKPEEEALDFVLKGHKSVRMPLETMKYLFEESSTKPSQYAVNLILSSISHPVYIGQNHARNWDFIEYLSSQQPDQDTIAKVLKAAVFHGQQSLVQKLCASKEVNAPTVKVIGELLIKAAKTGPEDLSVSLEMIKTLCEGSKKPTKEAVSEAVVAAINSRSLINPIKWDYLEYLCKENRPNQPAIDKILKLAAAMLPRWDFVKTLCENKDNPPSQSALGDILKQAAWNSLPLNVMIDLFETSITKPAKEDVNSTLGLICKMQIKKADSKHWDYINYLLDLKEENKPEQDAVNTVLKTAFAFYNEELLLSLSFHIDNAPSSEAVAELVIKAINDNKPNSLEMIKILCEQSINKPTTNQISDALIAALKNFPEKKDYVQYFCSLNPNQAASNEGFEAATKADDLVFAKTFFAMRNPPNQKAVSNALILLSRKQGTWSDLNTCKFIAFLCELRPDQEAINTAFIYAARANNLDMVILLTSMDKEYAPDQQTINNSLPNIASKSHLFPILRHLCELEGREPGQTLINTTLIKSVESGSLEIVQYLLALKPKPEQEAINAASDRAEALAETSFDSVKETFLKLASFLRNENVEKGEKKSASFSNSTFFNNKSTTKSSSTSSPNPDISKKSKSNFFPKVIPKKSCFSDSQIKEINARIAELDDEMNGCFSCFADTARKQQKIDGLYRLIEIGEKPEMTIPEAIANVVQDRRFSDLRTGTIYNRTAKLLDGFLESCENSLIAR